MQCFYIKPRRNAAFSSAGFSLCAFFCVLLKSKTKPKPKPKPDRLKSLCGNCQRLRIYRRNRKFFVQRDLRDSCGAALLV